MSEPNPYEAPSSSSEPKQENQKVRSVASSQRTVLLALLANIGINIASYLIGGQSVIVQGVFFIAAIAVIGFVMFAMYNLAKELNSQGLAILYAILMIVPCLSLIMLLVVNQQATGFLTANGIKVGLMGARMDQFE